MRSVLYGSVLLFGLLLTCGSPQSESLAEDPPVKEAVIRLIRGYLDPPIHRRPSTAEASLIDRSELEGLRRYYDFRLHGAQSPPLEETPVGKCLVRSHWFLAVPALPFDRSDAVILATVVSNEAFLTESRAAVFSVYRLKLESVYTSLRELGPRDTVTITREGGAIQMPSGKVVEFRIHGQGFPRTGERYLFFLDRIPGVASYRLLDGYCTNEDWVIPVDERPGHDYAGIRTKQLFELVRDAYPRKSWKWLP